MQIQIDVTGGVSALRRFSDQLTAKQLATGVNRAINRSLMQGRTIARSAVKEKYNIPQKNLIGIDIRRSTTRTLSGHVFASSSPIPMDAFSPKFSTNTQSISITRRGQRRTTNFKRRRTKGKLLTIEIVKGQRKESRIAFMAPNTKPRVFARGAYSSGMSGFIKRTTRVQKNGNDTPIKPLVSVSVHGAVMRREVIHKIADKIQRVFPAEVERQLQVIADGIAAP